MNPYQAEQLEALRVVRRFFHLKPSQEVEALKRMAAAYLLFRNQVHGFLSEHFKTVCTRKCYQSRLSACCSKDGIITFFADVVINAVFSTESQLDTMESVLKQKNSSPKCVYLNADGCMWRIKPIVCEMFLCDSAQRSVFEENPGLRSRWEELCLQERDYRWPDKPVVFDEIEKIFLDSGFKSSLMYFHFSPGLLKIKKQAAHF
jgi:hypothetical protein